MKPVIHFAHGNGFPSPCYHQLLSHLKQHFDVFFVDRVGHSFRFPVTENWHYLVEEVLASIKAQTNQPVIAVGHSLGGVLSFRAAIEEPGFFKAVILLDSPIIGRFKSKLLRLSKALGVIDKITPAFRTRNRKQHWDNYHQLITYLKSKPLFKTFTKECLDDYIQHGMRHDEKGYTLRFNPEVEYQIYRTIPHILHQYEGQLKVPAGLIYGRQSDVIQPLDIRYMNKKHHIITYPIKGSHMFPMESPERTASAIVQLINQLGVKING